MVKSFESRHDYLKARSHLIALFNVRLTPNFLDCGCAVFFVDTPQVIYDENNNVVNGGRKLLIPPEVKQTTTFTRLTDSGESIRLYFEETGNTA
jgi:hypothetical protein